MPFVRLKTLRRVQGISPWSSTGVRHAATSTAAATAAAAAVAAAGTKVPTSGNITVH
jgi:hypothetical protein